jgi:hypothetical protein
VFPIIISYSIIEESALTDNIVEISWVLPDSLDENFQSFKVLKRSDGYFKFNSVAEFRLEFSHSNKLKMVNYTDTLFNTNNVYYKIVGIDYQGHELLLKEYSFRIDPLINNLKKEYKEVEIFLNYKKGTPLQVGIWDSYSNQLIEHFQFIYNKKKHAVLKYNTYKVQSKEIRSFKVEIINKDDKSKQILKFNLDK